LFVTNGEFDLWDFRIPLPNLCRYREIPLLCRCCFLLNIHFFPYPDRYRCLCPYHARLHPFFCAYPFLTSYPYPLSSYINFSFSYRNFHTNIPSTSSSILFSDRGQITLPPGFFTVNPLLPLFRVLPYVFEYLLINLQSTSPDL